MYIWRYVDKRGEVVLVFLEDISYSRKLTTCLFRHRYLIVKTNAWRYKAQRNHTKYKRRSHYMIDQNHYMLIKCECLRLLDILNILILFIIYYTFIINFGFDRC